jgi:hypothetical protein
VSDEARDRTLLDQWLARSEEVTALLDCALRGCQLESHPLVERSLAESVRWLGMAQEDVRGQLLSVYQECLAHSESGRFEEAARILLDLRASWTESVAALRRDLNRADHLH